MTNPPLKVLQIVLSLAIGGTEKLVYDIVRHTDPQCASFVICCLDEFGRFGEELRQYGHQVYTLHRKPGIDWSLVPKIFKLVRQEKIDIIHAQQYSPYFYGLFAILYHKVHLLPHPPKLVFTEHGIPYPYKKSLKHVVLNPLLCRFADEIVTISNHTKSNLATYENFPKHKMKVVYNGIDLQQFSQQYDVQTQKVKLGIPPNAKVVGIVARLDPVKNHPMLLRAFQTVLNELSDTYLLIIGDGMEQNSLRELSASLNLADHVIFLGSRKDVPALLPLLDVFVLPSFSEGMSVTLIEAMGAGLPIVATDVGGNSEVIADRETGYLVPSDDEHTMAGMLKQLLQDTELRQKLGRAGQQRAHSMFSLDTMIRKYTEMYLAVCGIPPSS